MSVSRLSPALSRAQTNGLATSGEPSKKAQGTPSRRDLSSLRAILRQMTSTSREERTQDASGRESSRIVPKKPTPAERAIEALKRLGQGLAPGAPTQGSDD